MTKMLFCHDGPMAVDKNNNAYPVFFTKDVLARYYNIADEITVLTRTKVIDPKDTNSERADMEKLKIVSSPNLAVFKNFFSNRVNAKEKLEKELHDADFLIARLPSRIGNMAVDLAVKTGKPYLIELVGCPWDALWNYSLVGKINAPSMYLETKKKVESSKYTVYVTNDFLQKRYPTHGENTNCSNVELKNFDDQKIEERLQEIQKRNKKDKLILGTTAAVDVKYKGQQYVIEALGKLKVRGVTNIEYQLVGDGNQAYLRKLAEKNDVIEQVKFIGALPHKDVFKWLDCIDIYIQPSKQEGLPRALIEAMSKGIPSMGSRTAGIPELLEEEFIFSNSKKNVDEICKILNRFDKDTMYEQAKRNYEEAKLYDKNIIEKRRLEFFLKFKNSFS